YIAAIDAVRYPLGEVYQAAVMHPFFTDLQHIAWHAGYRITKDWSNMWRQDRANIIEMQSRTQWDAGGVFRLGRLRRPWLLGAMALGEPLLPSNQLYERDTIDNALTPTPNNIRQFALYNAVNLAGVAGLRALTFGRMRALDVLVAEQDVASGTQ